MPSIKSKNIYDVFGTVHSFSRVIGLTSFSIKKDNHKNYGGFVSFYDVLCLTISASWSIFTVTWCILSKELWALKHEYLSNLFEISSLVVVLCQALILLVSNFRFVLIKNKFLKILKMIEAIDETLMDLNSPINHSKHQQISMLFMILITAWNTLGVCFAYITGDVSGAYESSFFMCLTDFFSTLAFMFLCSQFILSMWSVRIRYCQVNSILIHNLNFNDSCSDKILSINRKVLTSCAVIHENLVEVSECISESFGVSVSVNSFCLNKRYDS